MKRRMRKFVASCIMILGIGILFPNSVNAQQIILEPQQMEVIHKTYDATLTEENYQYSVENGVATITKYIGEEENVVVPATIGGYPVKKVAASTFYDNRRIISITISEGIETLESGWVKDCTVESIHYSSTVKVDASKAGTPNWVPNIIQRDRSLITITVDENSKWLTVYNGDLYTKDMKVLIAHATAGDREKIVIPESVTIIADYAFQVALEVKEIEIPETVEYIGNSAFYRCEYADFMIPKCTKIIGNSAFQYAGITHVYIPESVTSIGSKAFWGAMTEEFTVDEKNQKYSVKDGCLYLEAEQCVLAYPTENKAKNYNIPSGTKKIATGAFAHCDYLREVIVPDTVVEIENSGFWNCTELEVIHLSSKLNKLGSSAFSANWNLAEIHFRGNAPEIGSKAFDDIDAMVYYPANNTTWTNEIMQTYGGEEINWVKYNVKYEAPAKPYKIANVVSGAHVYWNAIDGVAKYGLWRSETGKNGTYKWIANPTVPHFTDTKVESGKTYYYKVTALSYSNDHSEKSEPIGITYVSTPDITSRVNKAAGVQLGWNKITGATGYGIYRKSYSGSDDWVRIATVSGNATFTWTDETVKNNNGTVYKYTVRALAGSDRKTLSGCRSTGRTMVRLSSRVLNSATKASTTSIKCNWTVSDQVTGYEVRFMIGNKVYKTQTVDNWKTGTKTFTGLKSGQTYKVQIRSYKKVNEVGTFYSAWSAATIVRHEAPAKPYKIANVVSGVHVYWNAVSGVAKYGLWRSESGEDGTYKWVANPTVPHFTDTKVTSGKTYYYKVTTLSDNNDHSEKSASIGITYVATPDITSRVNKAAGVQLGWNKITGATGYGIYRKSYAGSDDWVRIATVSGNATFTWTDETVKNNNGTVYKYTVRALAGSDRKTLSGCRSTGRTMVRLCSRVLNSATKASATSIKCNWTTSSAVTGYEVRFMVGDKVYKTYTIGNYKTGTKTFTGLKAGQTYKVQVRTYKKVDGVGSFYSAWSVAKNVGL